MRARGWIVGLVAGALPLCPAGSLALAEDYWSYAYKGFDVTTAAGSAYTASLAYDLARFDRALTRILQLPERRVPTHVYLLAPKQLQQVIGQTDGVSYKFSGYEVSVVTSTDDAHGPRYWGALFGYTGSLLVNGRASRAPYWFNVGVPEVFALTDFEKAKVRVGGLSAGYARTLTGAKLIPTRILLRMQAGDPQLKSSGFQQLFDAQSWFLAREVYVEGKLRTEFGNYLGLMREGKREEEAFAASFKLSYEDLDKLLRESMAESMHQFVVDLPLESAEEQQPRKLSAAQIKALLAELVLQWGHREAVPLATEALQGDPDNELALRVLARANLQEGRFSEARTAVDRLYALPGLSAPALTDSAEVYARLARSFSKEDLSGQAPVLRQRAQQGYERAIALDPDYLRAWAGLAYLYGSERDAAAAQSLVTRAQPVMERHLDSGALARSLASMCEQTGQSSAAFLFGEYWRDDAINQYDLDQALAFMARLHGR